MISYQKYFSVCSLALLTQAAFAHSPRKFERGMRTKRKRTLAGPFSFLPDSNFTKSGVAP